MATKHITIGNLSAYSEALASRLKTALPSYTTVSATSDYEIPANATDVEQVHEITMGGTAYGITAADGVRWLGGEAPSTQANRTYLVSVVRNLAVWGEF